MGRPPVAREKRRERGDPGGQVGVRPLVAGPPPDDGHHPGRRRRPRPLMPQYPLSVFQEEGAEPPSSEHAEIIMARVAAHQEELKAAGAWAFFGALLWCAYRDEAELAEAFSEVCALHSAVIGPGGGQRHAGVDRSPLCVHAAPCLDVLQEVDRDRPGVTGDVQPVPVDNVLDRPVGLIEHAGRLLYVVESCREV